MARYSKSADWSQIINAARKLKFCFLILIPGLYVCVPFFLGGDVHFRIQMVFFFYFPSSEHLCGKYAAMQDTHFSIDLMIELLSSELQYKMIIYVDLYLTTITEVSLRFVKSI